MSSRKRAWLSTDSDDAVVDALDLDELLTRFGVRAAQSFLDQVLHPRFVRPVRHGECPPLDVGDNGGWREWQVRNLPMGWP